MAPTSCLRYSNCSFGVGGSSAGWVLRKLPEREKRELKEKRKKKERGEEKEKRKKAFKQLLIKYNGILVGVGRYGKYSECRII